MTTAQADPVRAALPDTSGDDVDRHVYAWYDPDAAAYGVEDPLPELEPLSDEDAGGASDRS